MNRREFFQGVVAVVATPVLPAPLKPLLNTVYGRFGGGRLEHFDTKLYRSGVRYYDIGSAYPYAMLKEFHERIVSEVAKAGGRVVYRDTDGVVIVAASKVSG